MYEKYEINKSSILTTDIEWRRKEARGGSQPGRTILRVNKND
jgi:hypothetical protein